MKKLTCRQLGGACDEEILGASFAEIGRNCREHALARIRAGDSAHKAAADAMATATPEEQSAMMAAFAARFEAAQEV